MTWKGQHKHARLSAREKARRNHFLKDLLNVQEERLEHGENEIEIGQDANVNGEDSEARPIQDITDGGSAGMSDSGGERG